MAVFSKFIILDVIVSVYLLQDHSTIGRMLVHILPFSGNVAIIEEWSHIYSIEFRGNADGRYEIFRSLRGRYLF